MRERNSTLASIAPEIERLVTHFDMPPAKFSVAELRRETIRIPMRDGVHLATEVYLPPMPRAPVIAVRTPYGRNEEGSGYAATLLAFAQRGYAVVSQDCRGTGDSEPESWDYYMFESEDSYDLIEWITQQAWFDHFIGACGGSYLGQTQWCMATHPAMSTIVPTMSGLGTAYVSAHLYMFQNAYSRAVGKGEEKIAVPLDELERQMLPETLAGGYFNEPLDRPLPEVLMEQYAPLHTLSPNDAKRWLWQQYCAMSSAQRARFVKLALDVKHVTSADLEFMSAIFGHRISQDAHTIPHANAAELSRLLHAPPLLRTGWYDWFLSDVFATWQLLRREGRAEIAARSRMIITPYAHNTFGYREGSEGHPELTQPPSMLNNVGLLMHWYTTVQDGRFDAWPPVIYYLMGANEWRVASDWPVPEAKSLALYLGEHGALTLERPDRSTEPDAYFYDPKHPTPTVGGSIVSYVYTPGSADVSEVQKRSDVLVYTTAPLPDGMDVVGPLQMILYASSTARDTDFVARLSDVFPDGRAIQLQSGILRARYRGPLDEPELLEPGQIYRFEIDLCATANRFKAGHRLRVDICSADFPHFDRNSNLGGEAGEPLVAHQRIYHDAEHASHLRMFVLPARQPDQWS